MSCWYFAVFKAIVMFYVESLYCILNISRCFENYIMRMWICCVILSIHQEKILRHSELPFMLSVEWNDETSTFCICYMFVNWNYILVPFMHKLDILDIFNNKKKLSSYQQTIHSLLGRQFFYFRYLKCRVPVFLRVTCLWNEIILVFYFTWDMYRLQLFWSTVVWNLSFVFRKLSIYSTSS